MVIAIRTEEIPECVYRSFIPGDILRKLRKMKDFKENALKYIFNNWWHPYTVGENFQNEIIRSKRKHIWFNHEDCEFIAYTPRIREKSYLILRVPDSSLVLVIGNREELPFAGRDFEITAKHILRASQEYVPKRIVADLSPIRAGGYGLKRIIFEGNNILVGAKELSDSFEMDFNIEKIRPWVEVELENNIGISIERGIKLPHKGLLSALNIIKKLLL